MEDKTGKVKKYRTTRGNLNTYVLINGKAARVKFVSGDNKEGFFTTSDALLQAALENDRGFGSKFSLSDESENKGGPEQAVYTEIKSVTTWQQAKELLKAEPYGIPLRQLSTPGKIKKAAQSCGLSFPNVAE